jgi:hypothetical protein
MVHHGRRLSVDLCIRLGKLAPSAIKNQKGSGAAEISQSEFWISMYYNRLHAHTNGFWIVLGQNSETASRRSADKWMDAAGRQSNGWLLYRHRGSPSCIRSSQISYVLGPHRCRKGRLRTRTYPTTGRSKPCARLL